MLVQLLSKVATPIYPVDIVKRVIALNSMRYLPLSVKEATANNQELPFNDHGSVH